MPTHKVKGGYKWGKSGKVYPTKAQADKQGQAIYASGWKGHVNEIDLYNNEEKQNVKNKDMKINKNIVRLTESQLKQMISESIKTALKEMVGPEGDYADYIGEDMNYDLTVENPTIK